MECCPAKKMLSDILAKPIQGTSFRSVQAILMNCPINYYKDTSEITNIAAFTPEELDI